jgi:hypothetical protein
VQVKSERERSMPCGASEEWRESRLGLRNPMCSGFECGLHGGKKSKTKSWTGVGAG